jgi:hypothetical protein
VATFAVRVTAATAASAVLGLRLVAAAWRGRRLGLLAVRHLAGVALERLTRRPATVGLLALAVG